MWWEEVARCLNMLLDSGVAGQIGTKFGDIAEGGQEHTTHSLISCRISRTTLYASSGLVSLSSAKPRDSMLRDSISRASMSSRID